MSKYVCPSCGSESMEVEVTTWFILDQYGENDFSTAEEGRNADHHWDEDSPMQCRDCGRTGDAKDFLEDGGEEN